MLKKCIKIVKRPVFFFLKLYWRIFTPETRGVKVILIHAGDVLLVKHTYGNKFTFPGGGLKKGETPEDGAKREVKEELGITLTDCRLINSFVSTLYYKKDKIHVYESELQSREFAIDNIEIDEARWVPLDHLPTFLSHSALEIFNVYKNKRLW